MSDKPRWMLQAACAGASHLFHRPTFVNERAEETEVRERRAVRVCLGCPVLDHCREWVMSGEDPCPWSVTAALRPTERRAARGLSLAAVGVERRVHGRQGAHLGCRCAECERWVLSHVG